MHTLFDFNRTLIIWILSDLNSNPLLHAKPTKAQVDNLWKIEKYSKCNILKDVKTQTENKPFKSDSWKSHGVWGSGGLN